METKEFKGNIKVQISKQEVRVWICNEKGQNIYRFKAMGKVFHNEDSVIIIKGD